MCISSGCASTRPRHEQLGCDPIPPPRERAAAYSLRPRREKQFGSVVPSPKLEDGLLGILRPIGGNVVELDFVQDLVTHLRTELISAGFSAAADGANVDDDHVGILYFNTLIRTIDPRPRKVHFAVTYNANFPAGQEQLVSALLAKVTRGDDLTPFQSRKLVKKKLHGHDAMLNDWGIHHLHLETTGTKNLLMCHVADDALYAIGFWPHDSWVSKDIIVSLIDSWPDMFERYRRPEMEAPDLTDAQLLNLRSKNVNALFRHPQRGAYLAIGGGLNSAGGNVWATTSYDRLVYELDALEEKVRVELGQAVPPGTRRLKLEFVGHSPLRIVDPDSGRVAAMRLETS